MSISPVRRSYSGGFSVYPNAVSQEFAFRHVFGSRQDGPLQASMSGALEVVQAVDCKRFVRLCELKGLRKLIVGDDFIGFPCLP